MMIIPNTNNSHCNAFLNSNDNNDSTDSTNNAKNE